MNKLGDAPRRPAARLGQPNVLSDAAIPNVLSTQSGRPRPLATGRGAQPTLRAPGPTGQTASRTAAQTSVRLPSVGTLIFLGFIAITAVRLLGEFASGITAPSDAPVITSPGGPTSSLTPGPITFGTGRGTDCDVTGDAAEFGPAVDVWWSAELSSVQPAEAGAVVIVRREGVEVHREIVPPDPSVGEWSVLCAGEPITLHVPGTYRVEVWSEDETVLHATGEYRVRDV